MARLDDGGARFFVALLCTGAMACSAADWEGGEAPPPGTEPVSVWPDVDAPEVETQPEGVPIAEAFERAAFEYDVPPEILKAVAWVETRAQMVAGHEELEGMPPAYGVMGLRGGTLTEGAALVGVPLKMAAIDLPTNVRAAAAVLSKTAHQLGIDRASLAAWGKVVAERSGITDEVARSQYVHGEVYGTLQRGLQTETLFMEPIDVVPDYPAFAAPPTPGPDYSASVWHASPNYGSRPSGSTGGKQMVIIHTCEGAYSGCWSWLTNSSSGVSAHYVVNSTGSEISQLVRESNRAYHIAAKYNCSLNGSTSCNLNGTSSNNFTVGIEHAGFGSQTSWDSGMIHASAKLVCDITRDAGIPRDSRHIVGHGQLQPHNRSDPGKNWPWAQYIGLVQSYCSGSGGGGSGGAGGAGGSGGSGGAAGSGGAGGAGGAGATGGAGGSAGSGGAGGSGGGGGSGFSVVVESNAASNGPDARLELSSSWTASTNVSGYYNSGYFWRSTGASSDSARFQVRMPATMSVVVEAWWPAASDRSPNAPFIIYDASGNVLGTVYVNQQQSGGQWVTLGTFTLTAGWNTVALSRWTGSGYVVVADAVRVRAP